MTTPDASALDKLRGRIQALRAKTIEMSSAGSHADIGAGALLRTEREQPRSCGSKILSGLFNAKIKCLHPLDFPIGIGPQKAISREVTR